MADTDGFRAEITKTGPSSYTCVFRGITGPVPSVITLTQMPKGHVSYWPPTATAGSLDELRRVAGEVLQTSAGYAIGDACNPIVVIQRANMAVDQAIRRQGL